MENLRVMRGFRDVELYKRKHTNRLNMYFMQGIELFEGSQMGLRQSFFAFKNLLFSTKVELVTILFGTPD